LLADTTTIARQIFSDTAHAASTAATHVANQIAPTEAESTAVVDRPVEIDVEAVPTEEITSPVVDATAAVGESLKETAVAAIESAQENIVLSDERKSALAERVKQVVLNLRKNTDYTSSVSTLTTLIKRYALIYSRVVDQTVSAVSDDVHTNSALDDAARNFWTLLTSFGDKNEWDLFMKRCDKVKEHIQTDPEFEDTMAEVGDALQSILTDPDGISSADQNLSLSARKPEEWELTLHSALIWTKQSSSFKLCTLLS